jgi:hypothetical protein
LRAHAARDCVQLEGECADEDDDDDDEDDNDEDGNAIAAVTGPTTGDIEDRGVVTDEGKELEAGIGSANKPAPKKLAALG